ncbi:MAG: pantoate--beta-alanine ligase [Candidatus Riflebacteria bacterium]|nr:pantoate--beta-alanine ligase [Candidatus Riflebacteria bacterium]
MFDFHSWVEMKKDKRPLVAVTAYDYQMTKAINCANVDMILVGDSLGMVVLGMENTTTVRLSDICHHVKAVARAKPAAPIVADMPFLSYGIHIPDTVYNVKKLIAAGAHAVKVEGGKRIASHIAALIENGIPVIGHIGLTPQSILRLGTYSVRGNTTEEAQRLVEDAKILDELGVSAIVLECIPEQLGEEITGIVRVPTIGIGAGRETDGQILVINDLLGMTPPSEPRPRFIRRFSELYETIVTGVRNYSDAVRRHEFPASSNVYHPDNKEGRGPGTGNMAIVRSVAELRDFISKRKGSGPVGFVPTMGALHAGHIALVEKARSECATVVASIYVNPTQFGPSEDLKNYPRNLGGDSSKLAEAGCDVLFFPDDSLMYGNGESTRVTIGGILTEGLCAKSRPGHFTGVATVVAKLLNIVQPDRMYLGQKDAQQVRVIRRMAEDLFLEAKIIECPTVREMDGLAMSSRNAYLSTQERKKAPIIYKTLMEAARKIENGEKDPSTIETFMAAALTKIGGITPDYAVAVDSKTLNKLTSFEGEVLLAVALKLGKARLIDNVIVQVPKECKSPVAKQSGRGKEPLR